MFTVRDNYGKEGDQGHTMTCPQTGMMSQGRVSDGTGMGIGQVTREEQERNTALPPAGLDNSNPANFRLRNETGHRWNNRMQKPSND